MPTKTVKKTVAKKAVSKARSVKRAPRGASTCLCVGPCRPEQSFWVNCGPIVDSLEGLEKALWGMSDEQFDFHTKRNGNDFAHWIRTTLLCNECADRIENATSRAEAACVLSAACTCRA